MGLDAIRAVLESGSPESLADLLADESVCFLVDHRADEDMIVEACEGVIQSGCLSAEVLPADDRFGFKTRMRFGSRSVIVPASTDRHPAVVKLSELLAPDYETRFCVDSMGDDTLAFVPLPPAAWRALEREFGGAVGRRFARFGPRPNLFTDQIDFG